MSDNHVCIQAQVIETLKIDLAVAKSDIKAVKDDIKDVKEDVQYMKGDVGKISDKIDGLKMWIIGELTIMCFGLAGIVIAKIFKII